jgi:hypothetical protein
MLHSFNRPSCDHPNYTWEIHKIKKLIIMHFSPVSSHFLTFRSKYSPRRFILKYIKTMS